MTRSVRICISCDPFNWDFIAYKINIISATKCIADKDFVNDVMSTRQSVITRLVIRFLWHDVILWITVTSYDKWHYVYMPKCYYMCGHTIFIQWITVMSYDKTVLYLNKNSNLFDVQAFSNFLVTSSCIYGSLCLYSHVPWLWKPLNITVIQHW